MQKLIVAVMLLIGFTAFSQQKVNFKQLDKTTFPCKMTSNYADTNLIKNPQDLSLYCFDKSCKKINSAKGLASAGFTMNLLGVAVAGISFAADESSLLYVGAGLAGVGLLFNAISSICFISHFQWDSRQRQVDLYFSPNGATLTF